MSRESLGNPFRPQEKPTVSDVEAVRDLLGDRDADELARLQGKKKFNVEEAIELGAPAVPIELSDEQKKELEFHKFENDLRKEESRKLSAFFGEHISVPEFPSEITREKVEFWKKNQFELHFLPEMDMTEKDADGKLVWKTFPGVDLPLRKSPDEPGIIRLLAAGWILADMRNKPVWRDGKQTYEHDDVIGPTLQTLRGDRIISPAPSGMDTTRFGIRVHEFAYPKVRQALAHALHIDHAQDLNLPSAIENSVLMHLHLPSWGKTDTEEWFADAYSDMQLAGGHVLGTLWRIASSDTRTVGFRPIVHFKQD